MLLPLLEDSLRNAVCKKVWLVLGLVDRAGLGVSNFLTSFEPGVTAAPNGFVNSGCGLGGGDLVVDGTLGAEPVAEGDELELDENFELMLDIHEFRLPTRAILWSLVFLGAITPCESVFSELERSRWGRWL